MGYSDHRIAISTDERLGAPETYRPDALSQFAPLQVTQAVDIWSIGCVFSEASVWVHAGPERLKEYQRKRRLEITHRTKGDKLLDAVEYAHRDIVETQIDGCWIVTEMLEQVVQLMLQHEPRARPRAAFVYNKAKRIIKGEASHVHFRLFRPTGTVDVEHVGPVDVSIRTMEPPQAPPEVTPDTPIRSGDRHVSLYPSRKSLLPSSLTANDDPPLCAGTSLPRDLIQSMGSRELGGSEPKSSLMGATESTALDRRPRLSLEEGLEWKAMKKRGKQSPLPGSENLTSLNQRDHVGCALARVIFVALVLKALDIPCR